MNSTKSLAAKEFIELKRRVFNERVSYETLVTLVDRLVEDAKWGKKGAIDLILAELGPPCGAPSNGVTETPRPVLSEADAEAMLKRLGYTKQPVN